MNYRFKKAISFVEVAFVVFVLIFSYLFVFKKIFDNMRNVDFRRLAGVSMTHLDLAGRNISLGKGFGGKFKNEWDMIQKFSEALGAEKICYDARGEGCWSNNWLWSTPVKVGIKTKENEFIIVKLISSNCSDKINVSNTCGEIIIDTNGNGTPNKIGKDILKFYVIKNGIIPAGTKLDIINRPEYCDLAKEFSWSCTAKYLNVK